MTFVNSNQTYTAQYVVTHYNDFLEFSLNSDEISYCVKLRSGTAPISIKIPSIYLGKPVTTIGTSAFYKCASLTSIVIPDSVTSIGEWAFWGCTSLTIYAEARSKPSGWSSRWNYSNCPVVWGYVG